MINLSKKLYISIFSLILMTIFAFTATYAWLKIDPNAWFEDMEMEISTNEDLEISLDGKYYVSKITRNDLKKSIVANCTYDPKNGEKVYELKSDTSGYYLISRASSERVSNTEIDETFKNVKLIPLTSNDGKTFYNRANQEYKIKSGYYISFDVYFRSKTTNKENYGVYFANREFEGTDGTNVEPTQISITNVTEADIKLWEYARWSFDTYLTKNTTFKTGDVLKAGDKISYNSFDKTFYSGENDLGLIDENDEQVFGVYASDAVRFSVTTSINNRIGDTRIYEINGGRGSYATDLSEDYYSVLNGGYSAKYDANKNAAFTYYNSSASASFSDGSTINEEPLTAIRYEDMPATFKGLDSYDASKILTLNSENNYGENGTAKMTFNLWLEGWDADCIDMVLDQTLSINLSFTNYSTMEEYDPIEVKYVDVDLDDVPSGEISNENIIKIHNQMEMLPISDLDPIKKQGKKFVGWKYKNALGEYQYWNENEKLQTGKNVPKNAATTGVIFYADYE